MSRCGCNSIREGSAGSYTLALLGVLCGYCEAEIEREQYEDWWNSLTPAEQVRDRWRNAQARIRLAYRPRHRQNNLPFPF